MESLTIVKTPWRGSAVVSLVVHCCLLGGVPLLLQLTKGITRFERPPTFQLVTAPASLKPVDAMVRKDQPIKNDLKNKRLTPGKDAAKKENVDELASLLDELPPPARVSAVGNFKYNWYLAQVQEKVERNWNPASENKGDSVVVAFTIKSDGSIAGPSLVKGSGNETLDGLALRAVTLAAPFGKLPPGVAEDKYDMVCTLRPVKK